MVPLLAAVSGRPDLKPKTSWNPVILNQAVGMGFGATPGLGAAMLSS